MHALLILFLRFVKHRSNRFSFRWIALSILFLRFFT